MKYGRRMGLDASKNKAGDVVRLAGGSDELSHLLHEILHRGLGRKIGQITNEADQARVGELVSGGIEGLDDTIGEKHECVADLQIEGSVDESGFWSDAKWQACGLEAFDATVGPADDG